MVISGNDFYDGFNYANNVNSFMKNERIKNNIISQKTQEALRIKYELDIYGVPLFDEKRVLKVDSNYYNLCQENEIYKILGLTIVCE